MNSVTKPRLPVGSWAQSRKRGKSVGERRNRDLTRYNIDDPADLAQREMCKGGKNQYFKINWRARALGKLEKADAEGQSSIQKQNATIRQ